MSSELQAARFRRRDQVRRKAVHRLVAAALLGMLLDGSSSVAAEAQAVTTDTRTIDRTAVLSARRPSLALPPARRTQLSNGLEVVVIDRGEVSSIPLVHIRVRIRDAGDYGDPAELPGMSRVTSIMLRSGASDAASQTLKELPDRAANLTITSDVDGTTLSATGFREDARLLLRLCAELIVHPAFKASALPGAIRAAKAMGEMPDGDLPPFGMQDVWLAKREMARQVQGQKWAAARDTSSLSEETMTRGSIVEFHRRYFEPDNTMVVISGLRFEEGVAVVDDTLGQWSGRYVARRATSSVTSRPSTAAAVRIVPLSLGGRIEFTVVSCGIGTPKRFGNDHVVGLLANAVLSQRLQEVATKQLADDLPTHGGMSTGTTNDLMGGMWTVNMRLWKQEAITRVLKVVRSEIAQLSTKPISNEEMAAAKGRAVSALHEIPFDAYTTIWQHRLPNDYYDNAVAQVEQAGVSEIRMFAKRYWDMRRVKTVVVGNGVDATSLSAFGQVSVAQAR